MRFRRAGRRVVPVWGVHKGVCRCQKGKACDRPGKHPRTRHGRTDATTDPRKIRTWKWTTANVGVATGPESGLVVIDIDVPDGQATLAELETQPGRLPAGPVVSTGGGGLQLWVRHPGVKVPSRSGIASGIDIRADGGLAIVPPSIHKSGRRYTWKVRPEDVPLPELPKAWLDFLLRAPCYIDHTRPHKTTEDSKRPLDGQRTPPRGSQSEFATDSDLDSFIESCIQESLPTEPRRRHAGVFKLARLLRGHPTVADWPLVRLQPIVNRWYDLAVEAIGAGNIVANADENWFDRGWTHDGTTGTSEAGRPANGRHAVPVRADPAADCPLPGTPA